MYNQFHVNVIDIIYNYLYKNKKCLAALHLDSGHPNYNFSIFDSLHRQ